MKINLKVSLLLFFLAVLVFVPMARASATNIYVGVQITATQPNLYVNSTYVGDPASLWCLPTGTTMGLSTGSTFSSYITPVSGSNPVTTIAPTCPGGTIWSALLNITSASAYTIRINPQAGSSSACSGARGSGTSYCWETWDVAGENKDCYAVCGHYNQLPQISSVNQCYGSYYANCVDLVALKGSPCTSCTAAAYTYYLKSTGDCFYHNTYDTTYNDPATNGCGAKLGSDSVRGCVCIVNTTNITSTFDFPWTAP